MAALRGKMTSLVILVLLLLFMAFLLTPLVLAPLGVFTGLARGMKTVTLHGWDFRPWFPFFPLWSFSLFFFIIWIAVVIWVYRDAERRGMNGLLWGLLVLFGNLIGLLIYLLVRQDQIQVARGQTTAPGPASKTTRTCPSCQRPVDKDFAYCPHCGTTIQQVCPGCKKPVERAWKVCPHCGGTLKTGE